jgi:hypothetical protein
LAQRKIRVGLAGLRKCGSSSWRRLGYYRDMRANDHVPGLTNVSLAA